MWTAKGRRGAGLLEREGGFYREPLQGALRCVSCRAGHIPPQRQHRCQKSGFSETTFCSAALRFAPLRTGRDVSRRGVCAATKEMVLAKPLFAALHFASPRYALGGT